MSRYGRKKTFINDDKIDFLRCLSVILVVFFHTQISNFKFWYIGVDSFFVISGFLITRKIIKDISINKFNINNFYINRTRRILPMVVFVILICFIISPNLLSSGLLRNFYQSQFSLSLFISNIYFFLKTGYFNPDVHLNPLLHTWSLSLEMQFYLIFPVLLIGSKFYKINFLNFLLLITFLSFLLFAYFYFYFNKFAFFSLPTRFWELSLGGLAAVISLRDKKNIPNIIGIISIIFVLIFSSFVFKNYTIFLNILMTLSVFLILLGKPIYTDSDSKILFFFKYVGKISYSFFLIHFVIFSFYKSYKINDPTYVDYLFLIILSLAISSITYEFIEKKFWKKQYLPDKVFILLSVLIISISIFSSLKLISKTDGYNNYVKWLEKPLPKKFKGLSDYSNKYCYKVNDPKNSCNFLFEKNKKEMIILVGDSHARVFSEPLFEYSKKNKINLISMTKSACPFLMNINILSNGNITDCTEDYQNKRLDFIKKISKDYNTTLIINFRHALYYWGTGYDNKIGGKENNQSYYLKEYSVNNLKNSTTYEKSLNDTINMLSKSNVNKIIMIKPIPSNGWDPIKRLIKLDKRNFSKDKSIDALKFDFFHVNERIKNINKIIQKLDDDNKNLVSINTLHIMCEENFCNSVRDDKILYADSNHFSSYGNHLLFNSLSKYLD